MLKAVGKGLTPAMPPFMHTPLMHTLTNSDQKIGTTEEQWLQEKDCLQMRDS